MSSKRSYKKGQDKTWTNKARINVQSILKKYWEKTVKMVWASSTYGGRKTKKCG